MHLINVYPKATFFFATRLLYSVNTKVFGSEYKSLRNEKDVIGYFPFRIMKLNVCFACGGKTDIDHAEGHFVKYNGVEMQAKEHKYQDQAEEK